MMPQSFHPLNTDKECTTLVRGEKTTTPQAANASNSHVPGVNVHQENTQFFPLVSLWSANFKCMKWCKSL